MSDRDAAKPERSVDPRAERSRASLHSAAISVVCERGTADVTLTDIAKAAGLSRQAAYLHYRDRNALLLDAASNLAECELLPALINPENPVELGAAVAIIAAHFDNHGDFYKPLFTGAVAYQLDQRLTAMLLPLAARAVERNLPGIDPQVRDDIAAITTGGTGSLMTAWLLRDDHSSPDALAARTLTALATLTGRVAVAQP